LAETYEHRQIRLKLDTRKPPHAERNKAVAVLQVSEGTLDGGAAP
jgi:hypothetical protein